MLTTSSSSNIIFKSINSIKNNYFLFLIEFIILCLFVYSYVRTFYFEHAGVDILWRISESKYFINRINPFEVFTGKLPAIPNFGMPAAYAFISYLINIPFTFIANKQLIFYIFTFFDILCLYLGLYILRKLFGFKYSFLNPFILLIILFSLSFLDHITLLNYGIIAVYGLILTFYGISVKKFFYIAIGLILVSLKPSLLIPLSLYLLIFGYLRILFFTFLINLFFLFLVALVLDSSPLDLLKQLQETQFIFSDKGFYRWEGILVFARDYLGRMLTHIGILASIFLFIIFRIKRPNNDPVTGIFVCVRPTHLDHLTVMQVWN